MYTVFTNLLNVIFSYRYFYFIFILYKTPLAPNSTSVVSIMKCIGLYIIILISRVTTDKDTGKM